MPADDYPWLSCLLNYPWLSCLWIILDYLADVKSASARLLSGDLANILSLRMADDAAGRQTKQTKLLQKTKLLQNPPDFSKRVGCRAEEEGEYSDELSWVVSRKTTFQTFWATIHQQRRVGDLQKIVQDEETATMTFYHILTFSRESQPVKGQ